MLFVLVVDDVVDDVVAGAVDVDVAAVDVDVDVVRSCCGCCCY